MIIKNVTVTKTFKDGMLAESFRRLGYPAEWKAGERRDLPDDLLKRVTLSGGQVSLADANAKESQIVEQTEPQKADLFDIYSKQYGKGKRVRVVFPEGFRDGGLAAELAAVGHPAEIGVGEIIELPLPLLEKIEVSGGFFSTDPETIRQTVTSQGKHLQRIREWQHEQERNKANLAKRQEQGERNKVALAEIEALSAEYITATGNEKQALWERIRELKNSLR